MIPTITAEFIMIFSPFCTGLFFRIFPDPFRIFAWSYKTGILSDIYNKYPPALRNISLLFHSDRQNKPPMCKVKERSGFQSKTPHCMRGAIGGAIRFLRQHHSGLPSRKANGGTERPCIVGVRHSSSCPGLGTSGIRIPGRPPQLLSDLPEQESV